MLDHIRCCNRLVLVDACRKMFTPDVIYNGIYWRSGESCVISTNAGMPHKASNSNIRPKSSTDDGGNTIFNSLHFDLSIRVSTQCKFDSPTSLLNSSVVAWLVYGWLRNRNWPVGDSFSGLRVLPNSSIIQGGVYSFDLI